MLAIANSFVKKPGSSGSKPTSAIYISPTDIFISQDLSAL